MKPLVISLAVGVLLFAAGCGSDAKGVASVADIRSAQDGATMEPEATNDVSTGDTKDLASDSLTDSEAAWMAFAQCLREAGLEVEDPIVDSDGNVQKPVTLNGLADSKDKAAWAGSECDEHIEGVTAQFSDKEGASTEEVDALLSLSQCLRAEGLDVDDPDGSSDNPGGLMFGELKQNWESPRIQAALDACAFDEAFGTGGKK